MADEQNGDRGGQQQGGSLAPEAGGSGLSNLAGTVGSAAGRVVKRVRSVVPDVGRVLGRKRKSTRKKTLAKKTSARKSSAGRAAIKDRTKKSSAKKSAAKRGGGSRARSTAAKRGSSRSRRKRR